MKISRRGAPTAVLRFPKTLPQEDRYLVGRVPGPAFPVQEPVLLLLDRGGGLLAIHRRQTHPFRQARLGLALLAGTDVERLLPQRLERGEAGAVFASGMGGTTALLLAHVRSGDHVVAARVLYGRTVQLLNHLQSAFGVQVSYIDANRPEEFARAVRPETRLGIVETISNPRDCSPRASSTMPSLRYTERIARRAVMGS